MTPGYLFMLGRSAAFKITSVRPVGGPENTSNIGENPSINNLARSPRPSTLTVPPIFFVQTFFLAHFRVCLVARPLLKLGGAVGRSKKRQAGVWTGWLATLNKITEAVKEVTKLTHTVGREVGGYRKAQRGWRQRKETRKKECSIGKSECSATSTWSRGEERTWESLQRRSLGLGGESRTENGEIGKGFGGYSRDCRKTAREQCHELIPNLPECAKHFFVELFEIDEKIDENNEIDERKSTEKIDENDGFNEVAETNRQK